MLRDPEEDLKETTGVLDSRGPTDGATVCGTEVLDRETGGVLDETWCELVETAGTVECVETAEDTGELVETRTLEE